MVLNDILKDALIETIPCAIFVIDRDRKIVFWNRGAEELTGLTAKEVVGSHCAGVYQRLCGGKKMDETMCPFTSDRSIGESECEMVGIDGRRVPVIRRSRLVYDKNGDIAGAVETLMDVSLVKHARIEIRQLQSELAAVGGMGKLIGSSEPMRQLYQMIAMVAQSDASVVIEGETGTGKELIARTIHQKSERALKRFYAVNCGALPEGLLEAELFGHVKGSFTGAVKDRAGCFEIADGGTLFLDEVGEMSLVSQVKLLRALQEGEITRVGDTRPRMVNVRIIAATNRNLAERVNSGAFREDLYYRLRVVSIKVPALRQRKSDIDELTAHFIHKFNLKYHREIVCCSPQAMAKLEKYDWPGNVRELEHAIEHGFVVTGRDSDTIEIEALPTELNDGTMLTSNKITSKAPSTDAKEELINALKAAGGNKTKTAQLLGITRAGLYKRMKRLGVRLDG